jgi:hypothetical protein
VRSRKLARAGTCSKGADRADFAWRREAAGWLKQLSLLGMREALTAWKCERLRNLVSGSRRRRSTQTYIG